ncbi:SDR family oxidoreductase [Sphingobacterium lactis]|uniref:SDR family oxidoreductase n=1 Tax=Sphingobacterium lactis TaxID=797291 RepID=UPI003DA5B97F
MQIDLKGKTALVGGASGGIGRAIAMELAACGASVVLMARNADKLEAARQDLPAGDGQKHEILVSDFADHEKHLETMAEFFRNHTIDILINNSNGPTAGDVLSKTLKDYQSAFDLLFQNNVRTTELALKGMREKGYGRIINVSSLTVKEPQDALVLSNTMRVALVSWSTSLAKAVAAEGITVNSILTGYFATDRLYSLMENQAKSSGVSLEEIERKRIASIPVKRLGNPEEYGYLAAFLASPYAGFLTGASIPLDGGLSSTLF